MPSGNTVYGSARQIVPLSVGGCHNWQQKKYSNVIYITKTRIKALDRPTERCDQENTRVNTSACIAEFIQRKVGCNVMTLGSQYSKSQPCTTKSQLLALANISKTLGKSDGNDIFEITGCLSACEKDHFREHSQEMSAHYGVWIGV